MLCFIVKLRRDLKVHLIDVGLVIGECDYGFNFFLDFHKGVNGYFLLASYYC